MVQLQWQSSYQKRPREKLEATLKKKQPLSDVTEGISFSHLKSSRKEWLIKDELSQISQGWQKASHLWDRLFFTCV